MFLNKVHIGYISPFLPQKISMLNTSTIELFTYFLIIIEILNFCYQ